MKSYFYLMVAMSIIATGITGCKCSKKVPQQEQKQKVTVESLQPRESVLQPRESVVQPRQEITPLPYALPSVIIYKTKADYSKNVPVGLNEEKTAIISYPGKTDLNGQMPTPLKYGFLLDRRGINTNVAFLKYTYDEYLSLETIPRIAELFNDILDADPITEMYNCGRISNFLNGDVEDLLNQALEECGGKPEEIYKKLK